MNRWRVHNGKKIFVEIGNFLDFKPSELVRTVSIAIDFRLMSPLSGSINDSTVSTTWHSIGMLSSDIMLVLKFRLSSGIYQFQVAFEKTNNAISTLIAGPITTGLNLDFVWVVSVTRSLTNPSQMYFG